MPSAVIGALRVNLGIDSAQFQDGLKNATKSLKGIGKSMSRVGAGMSAAITAPVLAFGASIVKTAGDFEAGMNRVGAATGSTAAELKAMRDMAVDLGAKTSFSASESADAMEMLAKNGLDASQIMGGAVAASMDLAAASGANLSDAADVTTAAMFSFGKNADDLAPVVDGITGVLLESKFGFDDYRLAIGQAGGVAGAIGVEFEDFNAALAATSNVFASGSDAGTSFKNFLTSLVPKSSTAAGAMQNLNLQFFDAQGKMKSMADIAQELQDKMGHLTEEGLSDAMRDIFGQDAMRTGIALMRQGEKGIEDFRARIADASAEEQAAARLKGFNGEMEKLSGAFETLQIAIAESGLLQTITDLVSRLSVWIDTLAETNPEILKWGTIIAGLTAALGPAILAVGLLVTGIAAIGAPIALAIAAIAAGTAAMIAFKPEIIAVATAITEFLAGAWAQFAAAWDGMVAKVQAVKASIVEFAAAIPGIFAALPAQMLEIGGLIMQGLWDGLKSKMAAVTDSITGFALGMVDSVKSKLGMQSPSKVMHEVGTNVMQGLGDGMISMQGGIESIATSIGSTISGAFKSVIDGSKSVKEAISDVLKSLASMMLDSAFKSLASGLFGGGGGGFLSNIFGGLLGFARGGTILPGGTGGIDSQVVAFRKSPNEQVSVTKPGQERNGGAVAVHVTASDLFHVMVQREADGRIQAASPRIVGAAVNQANANVVPTMGRYQRERAGGDYRG